ncbi:Putative transcriptional regulator, PAS and GerEdomains [Sodalis praecaptivus]|uniref:Putative transcriptional regulator, PAS and GerEdomains n=1 Tax=Sodalis praecaptivus TaxID=1239307 RepID=W0HN23_9GAMM|nr:PAS and helix-turn-helix domain-containing protein [Sodalis praecaptivus]AHF75286.1 Putative transcriptional regulator, PAS and GerEdomains [Sodalis praecaptivus]
MSGLCIPLKRENISRQLIYLYENQDDACFIRDNEARYVYINPAMFALLDLPASFSIEGKSLAQVPHWINVFEDEFKHYDKIVMEKSVSLSLVVTSAFGRENCIQPYIFDIKPFFDEQGNVVGTISEARPLLFFSAMNYINGKSPVKLTTHLSDNTFTERELEIIFFSYQGLSSKEIALRLGISHRTVENRLCGLYQRANVHNIQQFREFCKDLSFDYYIPESFLQPKIIVIEAVNA